MFKVYESEAGMILDKNLALVSFNFVVLLLTIFIRLNGNQRQAR